MLHLLDDTGGHGQREIPSRRCCSMPCRIAIGICVRRFVLRAMFDARRRCVASERRLIRSRRRCVWVRPTPCLCEPNVRLRGEGGSVVPVVVTCGTVVVVCLLDAISVPCCGVAAWCGTSTLSSYGPSTLWCGASLVCSGHSSWPRCCASYWNPVWVRLRRVRSSDARCIRKESCCALKAGISHWTPTARVNAG